MSLLAPTAEMREITKFWLDCLQVIVVIIAVFTAIHTYRNDIDDKRSKADQDRKAAADQLDTVKRELQRPYQEKQLSIYVDATRVVAHLAASPTVDKEANEARFWELYWGDLAFVESPAVEGLMVTFCHAYFDDPARCETAIPNPDEVAKHRALRKENIAIDLAREASKEIAERWAQIGQ